MRFPFWESKKKAGDRALAEEAQNWTLLAQFGSLSEEILFGDCGCIYFYIRKEDLVHCRFEKTWLILQCS